MELNKLIALVVKLDVDVVFCVNNIFSNLLSTKEELSDDEDRNYSPLDKQNAKFLSVQWNCNNLL